MESLYANKFLRVVCQAVMDLDKITATASPSPNRWSDKVPSREMTVEEIHEFVEAFAKCAKLLQEAAWTALRSMRFMRAICWTSYFEVCESPHG